MVQMDNAIDEIYRYCLSILMSEHHPLNADWHVHVGHQQGSSISVSPLKAVQLAPS